MGQDSFLYGLKSSPETCVCTKKKKHSVGIVFEKIVLLAQRKVSSVFERMGPITFGRHYLVKPSTTTFHLYKGQCLLKLMQATLFFISNKKWTKIEIVGVLLIIQYTIYELLYTYIIYPVKTESVSEITIFGLTDSIWQIQLWCPRSKLNMGEILAFLA